jgi:hypothetical protein
MRGLARLDHYLSPIVELHADNERQVTCPEELDDRARAEMERTPVGESAVGESSHVHMMSGWPLT